MDGTTLFLIALGVVVLLLITQRWFWVLVFGLCALASAFSCLASIFHFQILAAVGFFVLAFVLFAVTAGIADG